MSIEDRLLRLEKSNKYYKIALAICLCIFMVSAKDIFKKDEIHAKKIIADTLDIKYLNSNNIDAKYIYTDYINTNELYEHKKQQRLQNQYNKNK